MRRRRLLLFLVPCAVLIALIFLFSLVPGEEPRYKGRALSEWVDIYGSSGRGIHTAFEIDEAAAAIKHIGTNALPFLLRWLPYEYPSRRSKTAQLIDKLPAAIQKPFAGVLNRDRRFGRAWSAERCFELLGPDAAPAIPEMVRLAGDPNTPQTAG